MRALTVCKIMLIQGYQIGTVVYLFLFPGSQTDEGGKFQPHYPGAMLTVSVNGLLSFLTL